MRKVILYIAVSLDGYIADVDGSVDWIKGQDDSAEMQDTFSSFFAGIDTVVMGRRTYDQITTALSPNRWPYAGARTYVFTHRPLADAADISFTDEAPGSLVCRLRQDAGKDIWVCGGADVVNQLLKEKQIDVFHLAFVPVVLGGGVRLFEELLENIRLKLIRTLHYNGIIEAVYERS